MLAPIASASCGIGAATASLAARQGWAVVVNSRENRAAGERLRCHVPGR
ncbi:hypothetical protein [Verminephrobacter aporrectodeae]|nr:hypothetical protein [Verminephrobacter aporrectodeae]